MDSQRRSEPEVPVMLTVAEIRAIGVAMVFGTPDPRPAEITSARVKLAMAEVAAKKHSGRPE